LALSREGVQLCIVGRDPARLAETATAARQFSQVSEFQIDLTADESPCPLFSHLDRKFGKLDVLIHSAGVIHQGAMEQARLEDLDRQYEVNVRAPYRLTQRLLSLLTRARGQIVFINSSAGLAAKNSTTGQYAATKHALRAIADSLREEVNPKGVRVTSVYLGRTATPLQEALYQRQGSPYRPEALLQPEDVASTVVHALMLPPSAEVTDICIRPSQKSY
jgi:NADP-dependent 3-hydroxy acid dehydrogenase YdfG